MATFTKNGRVTGKSQLVSDKPEFIHGAHTGRKIVRPEDPRIELEYQCKYNGEADEIHRPCNGLWRPWTDFNMHKGRGVQDVCKDCGRLRTRNWKRRQNSLGQSTLVRDLQEKLGRQMNEAEEPEPPVEGQFEVVSLQTLVSDLTQPEPPKALTPVTILDTPLPTTEASLPTADEIQRVAQYLLTVNIGQSELDLARKTIQALETDIQLIEPEVKSLQERVAALSQDSQAMLDLAAQQERETTALNARIQELNTALALQEEYQHKLVDAGIRIPAKYKLFIEEED